MPTGVRHRRGCVDVGGMTTRELCRSAQGSAPRGGRSYARCLNAPPAPPVQPAPRAHASPEPTHIHMHTHCLPSCGLELGLPSPPPPTSSAWLPLGSTGCGSGGARLVSDLTPAPAAAPAAPVSSHWESGSNKRVRGHNRPTASIGGRTNRLAPAPGVLGQSPGRRKRAAAHATVAHAGSNRNSRIIPGSLAGRQAGRKETPNPQSLSPSPRFNLRV